MSGDLSDTVLEAAALLFEYGAATRQSVSSLATLENLEPFFEVFSTSPTCLRLKSVDLVGALAACTAESPGSVSLNLVAASFNLLTSRLADALSQVRCSALRTLASCFQSWAPILSEGCEDLLLKTGESVRLHTTPADLSQADFQEALTAVLHSLGRLNTGILEQTFSGQQSAGVPGLELIVREVLSM